MSSERFAFGDRVRHRKRPEWGIGSIVKAEDRPLNGQPGQRVSVRFPGVGVKTLSVAHAELERVTESAEQAPEAEEPHPVHVWDRIGKDEWLAPVAQRKIEEAMTRLPAAASDPFRSLAGRIEFMLGLYRFDRTGRAMIDWAVAQTGLDDPLTRFNRHELEQYFDRWALERDAQLARIVQEATEAGESVEGLFADAPPAARKAVRRLISVR